MAVTWVAPTSHAAASAGSAVSGKAITADQPGVTTVLATLPASAPATERAAAIAIDDITSPVAQADPLAGIPRDFASTMGYQPTIGYLADGSAIAINPNGGCSIIGGGRPFDLATVCKAHDLGYDILRYARRHGDPLGTEARRAVDSKFTEDLTVQCTSEYQGADQAACQVMADSFGLGVGFNSWRQLYGPPYAQAGMARTVGVLAIAALLVFFTLWALTSSVWRRYRSRRLVRLLRLARARRTAAIAALAIV